MKALKNAPVRAYEDVVREAILSGGLSSPEPSSPVLEPLTSLDERSFYQVGRGYHDDAGRAYVVVDFGFCSGSPKIEGKNGSTSRDFFDKRPTTHCQNLYDTKSQPFNVSQRLLAKAFVQELQRVARGSIGKAIDRVFDLDGRLRNQEFEFVSATFASTLASLEHLPTPVSGSLLAVTLPWHSDLADQREELFSRLHALLTKQRGEDYAEKTLGNLRRPR